MEVKIYQFTDEAFDKVNYVFRGWDKAKDEFNINDYECVYNYFLDIRPSAENDYRILLTKSEVSKILENVFYTFNQKRPEDFKGHSLSVSDVVSLDGVFYYCDDLGWEEIA